MTTNSDELLLIDLASILYPIWMMSQSEPDPDATSIKTVDRIRELARSFPTAAICCDHPKSFRKELDPTYKAQRPAAEAPLKHQIRLAMERLAADGFPVWCIPGFEADDVIATATARAMAIEGARVLIASADKDLLQLVSDRVTVKLVRDGSILDVDAVKAKYGIAPEQIRDYLSLVGDASDNITGAKGIGPKNAAKILTLFGSIDGAYDALDRGVAALPPAVVNSLKEFRDRLANVRQLVTLRTDAAIPFEEIAAERTPKDAQPAEEATHMEAGFESAAPIATVASVAGQPSIPNGADSGRASVDAVTAGSTVPRAAQADAAASVPNAGGSGRSGNGNGNGHGAESTALVPAVDVLAPAPEDWNKQLEPRSIREARGLAADMYAARLFNGYGAPAAVLSTVLAGRELGMPAIASLRAFHIVEGKHCLAADAIRALVMRSGQAKFFRCTERTDARATFEAQRGDDPPLALTYSMDDAQRAGVVKKGSGWEKHPADMLVARASSKLARLMFPDVVFGLYSPEEFEQ